MSKATAAVPVWHETPDGAFDCGDEAEDFFRFRSWAELGFDLVEYDRWLRTLPESAARDDLIRNRDAAKAEMQPERMRPHLHLMWISRKAIERQAAAAEREAKLEPMAAKGAAILGRQAKRRGRRYYSLLARSAKTRRDGPRSVGAIEVRREKLGRGHASVFRRRHYDREEVRKRNFIPGVREATERQ